MVCELLLGIAMLAAAGSGDTIRVSQDLTAAIRNAKPGTVIHVAPGIYREPTILIDKRLTLIGDGWPVLDGENTHQIMSITADDVTVHGFVFRNVGSSFTEDRAAIKVAKASGCTIDDNRL